MNLGWEVAAIAGWAALLLNLLLTLRLVQWLRSFQEGQRLDSVRAELPELPLGEPAPAFRARDLSGSPVRSEDFLVRETALVFVSPHCSPCRRDLPGLVALATLARQAAGAEIVLVSDSGAGETQSWVTEILDKDQVDLPMPMLATGRTSDFLTRYNPRGLVPYFCHIDTAGNVTARGGLHSPAWAGVVKRWDAAVNPNRRSRSYR
jgi:hypothetical protein